MSVVLRAQIAFGADTAFPRDRIAITPHFLDSSSGNEQSLADDLANKFQAYFSAGTREVVVKVYQAQQPKPNPPVATATRDAGLTPNSPGNREVALCLTYFAGSNIKRHRGRLYIPAFFLTTGTIPVRPTTTHQNALAQFVTMFVTSGPTSVQWAVYSRRDAVARPVTNWSVDDEWDTQRRRGLRATGRTVTAVPVP